MVKVKKSREKGEEKRGRGKVISRLNHPVVIAYEGKGMVIPPRGRVKVADLQLLGSLPTGVVKI